MKNPRSLKTEQKKYKTDRFTLLHERPDQWKVSGKDSIGRYRRIRFEAQGLSQALHKAEQILDDQSMGFELSQESMDSLQISDALIRSCENRNWTDYTRKSELACCDYFLQWVDGLGLTYWHELRYEHVLKYQKCLVDRDLAYDTIRLYLLPVRRTAKWVASNWPKEHVDICQNLRLSRRLNQSMLYDEEEGNPFLSIHQVLDFLQWLSNKPNFEPMMMGIALQGLAGLQLQEALRLTSDKVDWGEKTLTIDGAVKNRYRIRRIPVCSIVMGLLRRYSDSSQPTGNLIPHYANYSNYSHAVSRELKRWDSSIHITPKDLRNTIQTVAIDGGWYGYYVQRYVGHAPQTIGERHYHGDKGKRLIPLFRNNVVSHIEEEIRKWKAPSKASILPEPNVVSIE